MEASRCRMQQPRQLQAAVRQPSLRACRSPGEGGHRAFGGGLIVFSGWTACKVRGVEDPRAPRFGTAGPRRLLPPLTSPRLPPVCLPAVSSSLAHSLQQRPPQQQRNRQQQQQHPARRRGQQRAATGAAAASAPARRRLAVRSVAAAAGNAAAVGAAGGKGPVVVVDNYDSFTYNLCQVGGCWRLWMYGRQAKLARCHMLCTTNQPPSAAAGAAPTLLPSCPCLCMTCLYCMPVPPACTACPAVPGRPWLRVRCFSQR